METTTKKTESTLSNICNEILQNHLHSFLGNNLESLMSDFTNDSVLITQDAIYSGLSEIRNYYTELMLHFPKQKSVVELEHTVIKDELIYIIWHGSSPGTQVTFATDTFIIKNGKIWRQTFAGQIKTVA